MKRDRGFTIPARLLHWTIAALVVVQIPAGVAMTSEALQETGLIDPLFILHKGAGSVLLVLVLLRVGWRLTHPAPPLPDEIPPLERRIAGTTHVVLYLLLLAMVGSGYVRTVADGFPIELLDAVGIPPLLPQRPDWAQVALVIHQFAAYALVALASVHAAAVLHHRLILRDGILSRMWPPWRRSAPGEVEGESASPSGRSRRT